MKSFFAILLIVPFLFAVAQDNGGCEPGWEPVILNDEGDVVCQRIQTKCPNGQTRYIDEPTNARQCCPDDQQLVIYNKEKNYGICCGADQVYLGTAPDGKCCQKGEILKDGKCIPAPPSSTCQGCPAQPPGACQLKAACGDATNNGLGYGKCYQIVLPTGKQLGRWGTPANTYTQDGYIQNIPYKICKTTADCGTGPVKAADNFYIQDLIGPADGPGTPGWMGSEIGGAHMVIRADPALAGKFNGRTSCSSCKCVVQLTGIGYACPFDNPGVTFWPNKKVTLKLQFLEIPCSGKFNF